VTLRVSKGPQPIAVPNVVGETFDTANSQLLAAGFAVAKRLVDSSQPANTVVASHPAANTSQPPGTTITLDVSKGPATTAVPDVTSQAQADAISTLRAAHFNVRVVAQNTSDPTQDGIVLSQNPQGASQAKPGTTVTIVVGRFTATTTPTTVPTPVPGQ
jgi:serine/threonine-protein kinase